MKTPLPPHEIEKITRAAAAGRQAWENGAVDEAERNFLEAWNVLPEPKAEQGFYSQDLSRALTNFYKATGQFQEAERWLEIVRRAYGGEDASVDFLAGTVALDAGDPDEAYRLFDNLFLQFGTRPFDGKDPKYLDFYRKASGKKTKS